MLAPAFGRRRQRHAGGDAALAPETRRQPRWRPAGGAAAWRCACSVLRLRRRCARCASALRSTLPLDKYAHLEDDHVGIRSQPDDVGARFAGKPHATDRQRRDTIADEPIRLARPDFRLRRRCVTAGSLCSGLGAARATGGPAHSACAAIGGLRRRPAGHPARRHHRADPDRHPGVPGRGPAVRGRGHGRGHRRSGAVGPVPAAGSGLLHRSRSATSTRRPAFQDWRVISAQALVVGRTGRAPRWPLISLEFRVYDVLSQRELDGKRFAADAERLAPSGPPRRRPGLRAPHRREGLLRHPGRLHRRDGPQGPAPQAARDHGPGRRQRPAAEPGRRTGAHPAVQPDRAGDHLSCSTSASSRACS